MSIVPENRPLSKMDRARAYGEVYAENYKKSRRIHTHRDRALLAGCKWETYDELDVLDEYGTDCYWCGGPINLEVSRRIGSANWEISLHIDHVIPIKVGGGDVLDNVRPSHGICNLRRRKS